MSEVELGGFGRRLVAALLDSVVWLIAIGWLLGSLPDGFGEEHPVAMGAILLALLSAWFNYFAVCEWRFGQTIGKNALGLRVVPVDAGARLSYNAAAVRNLLRLVDLPLALLGIDYLIVRASPRNQRLGDRAARTLVIRAHPPAAPATQAPAPAPAPQAAAPAPAPQPAAPAPAPRAPAGEQPATLFNGSAQAPELGAGGAPSPAPPPASEPRPRAPFPYATWGAGAAFLGLALAVVIQLVLSIPVAIVAQPDGGDLGAGGNIALQAITAASFVLAPLIVAMSQQATASGGAALRALGVRAFRPSALKWMLAAVGAYLAIAAVYAAVFGAPKQEDIAEKFGPVAVQVLLIALAAPISEEICFRGMLYGGLRTRMARWPAALVAGVVFGGLHALTGVTAVPPLIVFGVILSLLYERTGSVVPGMILHMLNNSVALLGQ